MCTLVYVRGYIHKRLKLFQPNLAYGRGVLSFLALLGGGKEEECNTQILLKPAILALKAESSRSMS